MLLFKFLVRLVLILCIGTYLLFFSLIFGIFISWSGEQKVSAVDLENIPAFNLAAQELWQKTLQYKLIGQVVIKHNGKILLSGISGGDHLDSPTLIGSVSKQFIGEKILELVQNDQLQLDDPLCKFLKEYCPGELRLITIRHLMTHTAGLPVVANGNIFTAVLLDNLFSKSLEDLTHPKDMAPLEFNPGSDFSYSNLGFDILARVLEIVENQRISDVMKDFFVKHGLHNTFLKESRPVPDLVSGANARFFGGPQLFKFWIPAQISAFENFAGSGAVVSTANDMILWLEQQRQSRASEINLKKIPQMKIAKNVRKDNYYFGGWIANVKKNILWHNGYVFGYKSGAFTYPKTGITAFFSFNNSTFSKDEQKVIDAWQDLFLGHEYVVPDR